jgi:hypothetical protein
MIIQKSKHIPTSSQTMAFAALAILGQRSAHSLPIGPVIAEPARGNCKFVKGHAKQISLMLMEELQLAVHTFHLTLGIHNHSSIIWK